LLSRSLYLFSSKLVAYAIRLVLPYFLVRLLTVEEFGTYRQFFLLQIYVQLIFQMGVNQALFYFIPRDEENAGAYFVNSLLLNVAIFGLALGGLGLLRGDLADWLRMPLLAEGFGILALYILVRMPTICCDCYLNARGRVKAAAIFEVSGQVLVSLATVAAAFYTREVHAVLQMMAVARAVQLVLMLAYIGVGLDGFRARRYLEGIGAQVRYGLMLGLAGTLWAFQFKLHEFFVSRYFGPEGYAVYSAGCTEIPVMQMFSQAVAAVVLSRFALLEKQDDWEAIRHLWRRILTSMYAVGIPVVAFLVLIAEPLIRFVFTQDYVEAVSIFRVNSLIKLNMILNSTLVIRAMDRNDLSIWTNLGVLVATPFVLQLGYQAGGMDGIIMGQFALLMCGRIITHALLNRVAGARLNYLVAPAEVWGFYKDISAQGWAWMRLRISPGGRAE
jgi:O-antigen/teichoic acid export membrane protein